MEDSQQAEFDPTRWGFEQVTDQYWREGGDRYYGDTINQSRTRAGVTMQVTNSFGRYVYDGHWPHTAAFGEALMEHLGYRRKVVRNETTIGENQQ